MVEADTVRDAERSLVADCDMLSLELTEIVGVSEAVIISVRLRDVVVVSDWDSVKVGEFVWEVDSVGVIVTLLLANTESEEV